MESGGLEISRLARDIAESIGHQEGDTMPSALRMEFVQRVLDKAEAIGGFDFSAYEDDDDDDDFDDGDDFDDDDDEDLESDGNFGDGDDDDDD